MVKPVVNNKDNDRLEHALRWCREHEVKNRLDLFNRGHKKKLTKGDLNKKEFKGNVKKGRDQ